MGKVAPAFEGTSQVIQTHMLMSHSLTRPGLVITTNRLTSCGKRREDTLGWKD